MKTKMNGFNQVDPVTGLGVDYSGPFQEVGIDYEAERKNATIHITGKPPIRMDDPKLHDYLFGDYIPPVTVQAITVSNTGLIRRIVTPCAVSTARDPDIQPDQIITVQADALWVTGATRSAIVPALANQLKLMPVGNRIIDTANGQINSPLYKVDIALDSEIHFDNVIVEEAQLLSTQVLLGMDVISQGDLTVTNGNGKTTFSFQIPATRNIDFEKE